MFEHGGWVIICSQVRLTCTAWTALVPPSGWSPAGRMQGTSVNPTIWSLTHSMICPCLEVASSWSASCFCHLILCELFNMLYYYLFGFHMSCFHCLTNLFLCVYSFVWSLDSRLTELLFCDIPWGCLQGASLSRGHHVRWWWPPPNRCTEGHGQIWWATLKTSECACRTFCGAIMPFGCAKLDTAHIPFYISRLSISDALDTGTSAF